MNVQSELDRAWQKAQSFSGKLSILGPSELDPEKAAGTFMDLLEQTYGSHGVSQRVDEFASGIRNHQIDPWIVTRDAVPVACAALIKQNDGSVEVGRAVSIENNTGVGKIAMLEAAKGKKSARLVAEIRFADTFGNIPSGEATQRICTVILGLTIHAVLPPFRHGRHPISGTKYSEMFGFAAEDVSLKSNSIITTAKSLVTGRDHTGQLKDISVVADSPFRIGVPSCDGENITDFQLRSRNGEPGCTMVTAEVTDQNLATITWLLDHEFILSGIDRNLGSNGLPVVLLATLARCTLLAPTKPSDTLPRITRNEISLISNQFSQLIERN